VAAPVNEPLDVRQRILSASLSLLENEGLSALSMREVSRRAGVSHQAPYNHFADREAILGALAQQGFAILAERIEAERNTAPSGDTLGRLRACFHAYVEFACTNPAHFRLMFRPELVDLENCPGALAEGDRAFAYLTDGVRELQQAGLRAEPSLDAITALVWSSAHGLSCLLLDGPLARKMPNAQREELVWGVTEAFTAMIAARIDGSVSAPGQPRKKPGKAP
jgi:AcrR family transcriptional regulator